MEEEKSVRRVDFDVNADGALVFYEANATMNLFSTAQKSIPNPKESEEAIDDGAEEAAKREAEEKVEVDVEDEEAEIEAEAAEDEEGDNEERALEITFGRESDRSRCGASRNPSHFTTW